MVTDIMQESTDAIYKFEDDAISLADKILKDVLVNDLRIIVADAIETEKPKMSENTDSDYDADHMAERSENSGRHLSTRGNIVAPGKRLFEDRDESNFLDEMDAAHAFLSADIEENQVNAITMGERSHEFNT